MSEKHRPGPLSLDEFPHSGDDPATKLITSQDAGIGVAEVLGGYQARTSNAWSDADEATGRLLAAAYTSYDRHCGARAVGCAERDLLGTLLDACEATLELFDKGFQQVSQDAVCRQVAAALAQVKG